MNPFDAIGANPAADPLVGILARPRVEYTTADPDAVARRYAATVLRRPALRPAQVSGLLAMEHLRGPGGTDGPRGAALVLGCGHGKTLLAQLAPVVFGTEHYLIFEPAALHRQFRREADTWRQWYRVPKDVSDRLASYELLSQPHMRTALEHFSPDLLVFDESHLLGNPDSARWKRIARYLTWRSECRCVILSGTMTSHSIHQMSHLLYAALRDWSPIPNDATAQVWSNVIDLAAEPAPQDIRYMGRMAEWARETPDRSGIRRAFAVRLRTSAGVVVSHGLSADVSLRGRLWGGPPQPPAVAAAVRELDAEWRLPDGTELVEALEMDRHSKTLALGFYARWVPGTGHPEWFERRKAWNGHVRARVSYGGFDSPALVEDAVKSGRLSARELAAWEAWVKVRPEEPATEVIWLDGGQAYLRSIPAAYASLRGPDPAVFWAESRVVGPYLGLPYHGAMSAPPTRGSATLSIAVHGKGWNGQHYYRQLVLEPPASGGTWEQLLARMHRPGQTRDVDTTIFVGTKHARRRWFRARDAARYIRDTTGENQRILMMDLEDA